MSASTRHPAEAQDLQELRELAEAAARAGGELARASFGQTQTVTLKADGSEVTESDLAAERVIVAHIRNHRPGDWFIGEEATQRRSDEATMGNAVEHGRDARTTPRSHEGNTAEDASATRGASGETPNAHSAIRDPRSICWVIDPLDGTRNYVRGLPIFTCSVAALRSGTPVAGAVYDPIQDVMYSAASGQGVFVNSRRTSSSAAAYAGIHGPALDTAARAKLGGRHATEAAERPTLDRAQLCQGLPLSQGPAAKLLVGIPSAQQPSTRHFVLHALQRHVVRNLGSAALHLALTATGQLDVTVMGNGKLWDIAAGWLLVTEAGGVATSPDGVPLFPLDVARYAGEEIPVLAGQPAAHAQLMRECAAGGVRTEPRPSASGS